MQNEKLIIDGTISSEKNYKYKYYNGIVAEEASYNSNGEIMSKTYYTYDKKDRLIEERSIGSVFTTTEKHTYEDGLLKKSTNYINEDVRYFNKYNYLSDGKLASIQYYQDNELYETIKFEKYDAIGNAILIKCYDNNGKLDWERQYEIMYR